LEDPDPSTTSSPPLTLTDLATRTAPILPPPGRPALAAAIVSMRVEASGYLAAGSWRHPRDPAARHAESPGLGWNSRNFKAVFAR